MFVRIRCPSRYSISGLQTYKKKTNIELLTLSLIIRFVKIWACSWILIGFIILLQCENTFFNYILWFHKFSLASYSKTLTKIQFFNGESEI